MHYFIIDEKDNGVRLNRFLEKAVPKMTAGLMYRCLRQKKIKLNGKKCDASARLSTGDNLEIFLPDEIFEKSEKQPDFMKASSKIEILYEDNNIMAVYKPTGLICHSDKTSFGDTLVDRIKRYLYVKGEFTPGASAFVPALANRIDRNTQGIVLAAKNSSALSELTDIIRNREIDKEYLCITSKELQNDGIYTAFLRKEETDIKAVVKKKPSDGFKEIITEFKKAAQNDLFLYLVNLHTGRTHQIRAHISYLGCPILGDEKYGSKSLNKKYGENTQLLCAFKIVFHFSGSEKTTLGYLDGKEIRLKEIDFVSKYFPKMDLSVI